MVRHTAGHFAQALLLLVGVVIAIFCLLQLIPGDPVQAMVGDMPVPPALRASLEQRFHLNDPFPERLYSYLSNILHGDLARQVLTHFRKGPVDAMTSLGLGRCSITSIRSITSRRRIVA